MGKNISEMITNMVSYLPERRNFIMHADSYFGSFMATVALDQGYFFMWPAGKTTHYLSLGSIFTSQPKLMDNPLLCLSSTSSKDNHLPLPKSRW
jgi:hypothetical protein